MKLVNKGKIIWESQRLIKRGYVWGIWRSSPHLNAFWKCIYVLDPAALGFWSLPHAAAHAGCSHSLVCRAEHLESFCRRASLEGLVLDESVGRPQTPRTFSGSLQLSAWRTEEPVHGTSLNNFFHESLVHIKHSGRLNTYRWPGRVPQKLSASGKERAGCRLRRWEIVVPRP